MKRFFKAIFKATGKISGFGIDDSLEVFQSKWDLHFVKCEEITQSEYLRLQELQKSFDYANYFQIDY